MSFIHFAHLQDSSDFKVVKIYLLKKKIQFLSLAILLRENLQLLRKHVQLARPRRISTEWSNLLYIYFSFLLLYFSILLTNFLVFVSFKYKIIRYTIAYSVNITLLHNCLHITHNFLVASFGSYCLIDTLNYAKFFPKESKSGCASKSSKLLVWSLAKEFSNFSQIKLKLVYEIRKSFYYINGVMH